MKAFSELLPGCNLTFTINLSCKKFSDKQNNIKIAAELSRYNESHEEFLSFEEYARMKGYIS